MLSQTYRNFELIILEDGSTDGSLQYLLTINDPRIRLLHDGMNRGLSYRLNQGILAARGNYICRMDADDISMPDRLRMQAEYLDTHSQVDLVGGRSVAFSDNNNIIGYLPYEYSHEDICASPWNRFPLPHPTWMARREWYLSHPYRTPEVFRAEDQDLLLSAYPFSRYSCIADVVLAYRLSPSCLRRVLIARCSLLKAQLSTFHSRKQYGYILLAIISGISKSILDLISEIKCIGAMVIQNKTSQVEPEVIRAVISRIRDMQK